MGKFAPKPSKPAGPSEDQLKSQADSDKRSKRAEERSNKELSSAARFATKRRTGRRLLLAPGREDQLASLGGGGGSTEGGNF